MLVHDVTIVFYEPLDQLFMFIEKSFEKMKTKDFT